MDRTFEYAFDAPTGTPDPAGGGPNLALDVRDIEGAGIREVLQTPGASFGSWAIIDDLLEPTGPGTPFRFKEPLGQAREVKVALSGLFGRFVARAYLEQFMGLSFFMNVRTGQTTLDGRRRVLVSRKPGSHYRGDLPDWLSCDASLTSMVVGEAKGSHDPRGPNSALGRAWTQTDRLQVHSNGARATLKRVAVVTRWGAATGPLGNAMLSVRDPIDHGELDPEQVRAAMYGIARRHVANLLEPIGYEKLAKAIRRLAFEKQGFEIERLRVLALEVLDEVPVLRGEELADGAEIGPLVGGVVTRAGALTARATDSDLRTLSRLGLKPILVGLEHEMVKAVILEDGDLLRSAAQKTRISTDRARSDRGGTWVIAH